MNFDSSPAFPVVKTLWTGGFDSTFRIVQLSRKPVTVKPFYVVSPKRRSSPFELAAISKITALLQANPNTRCNFEPLEIVERESIKIDPEISAAFDRLFQKDYLGNQYVWLASFAVAHPGLELSIQKNGTAMNMIENLGKLERIDDDILGPFFVIDKAASDPDIATLFGDFRYPLAAITKRDMQQWYVSEGYADVMNATWFCYNPTHGKPCGHCNPCRYTIEEGLEFRFTRAALFRYALHHSRPSTAVKTFLKNRLPFLARLFLRLP